MKAAVFTRYGSADVVSIADRPVPDLDDHGILIRVVTTTVNSGDWRIRSLSVPRGFGIMVRLAFGVFKPRVQVLGTELAGVVAAIGNKVTQFNVGDEVIAMTGMNMGAHAEYVALEDTMPIVPKPANLGWPHAAALSFGGTAALDFLVNKGKLKAGDKVLINGASGTVGSAAVQLALHLGARVTAVCGASSADMASQLGADQIIDYRTTDFTSLGTTWDLILDTVGNAPWKRSQQALSPGGRLLMVVADFSDTIKAPLYRDKQGRHAIAGTARESRDDVARLATLASEGQFLPVIAERYPFADIREAHKRLDQGSKHGSLVIEVSHPDTANP